MSIPTKSQILKSYDGREVAFVEEILIPLFQGMGYACNFNHGAFELGKDILLRRPNHFGLHQYTAVVAKVGDIGNTNAKARNTLQEVERQIDQAWTTPFNNAEWKERDKHVSNVIVVTNGNISNSAEQQILTKLTPYNKENTFYFSQEKLIELLNQYYPEIWTSELPTLSRYLNSFKAYIERITETANVEEEIHNLIATYCQKKLSNPDPGQSSSSESPVNVISKGGKRIWFQGGTGSGKTFIAHNYARVAIAGLKKDKKTQSARSPVPVYLKAIWFATGEVLSLKDILKRSFKHIDVEISESDLDSWISTEGLCIFYDELEMNENPGLLNFIDQELKKSTKGSSIILLSRFMDENSIPLTFNPEIWHIKEINLSQASKALAVNLPISNPKAKQLYREVIQGGMLERLPRTPLAINILRKIFVDMEIGKLPNNAYEFLDMYFEVTLGRWELKRDPSQPLDYKQVKALLQTIAFRMVTTAQVTIRVEEIADIAKGLLETTGQKNIDPIEYINKVASFGEVCRVVDGNFEFVQRTFLEFLAGCELKDHHWTIDILKENFTKVNWEESIIFAAGGKQKDDSALRALADQPVNSFSERFTKLKNLGLIAQALYHSSVEAKEYAISSGAGEAVAFRDDKELPALLAQKKINLAELTYSFSTLHLFSMFYGKHSLQTALERRLQAPEEGRKSYYYASAYSMLSQSEIDDQIFSDALKKLSAKNSPEGTIFGGFLEHREKMLNRSIFKKMISGKKTKQFAKRTKAIILDMRRKVDPASRK